MLLLFWREWDWLDPQQNAEYRSFEDGGRSVSYQPTHNLTPKKHYRSVRNPSGIQYEFKVEK